MSQPMQASVTETPYCKSASFVGDALLALVEVAFHHQADDRLVTLEDLIDHVVYNQWLQFVILVGGCSPP